MPPLIKYKLFKLSFIGADSFYIGYTNKSINYSINKLIMKNQTIYNFINSVGVDNLIIEDLGRFSKNECIIYINNNRPNLN